MDLKKLIWVFSAVFCVCVLAAAEKDFSNIEIEEDFRPFLTAKKRFMNLPGVRIFSTPDRKGKMIISVASVASKGSSGKAYADMIKIGRIKAQVELLKFQGVELSAFTKVSDKIISVDDGKKEKVKSISFYLNVVEERVNGVVRAMPVIGTWFSKDKTEFFVAIGRIVECKK